jgi:hypothetical protein
MEIDYTKSSYIDERLSQRANKGEALCPLFTMLPEESVS